MLELKQAAVSDIEFTPPGGITTVAEVGDLVPRRGGPFIRGFARFMMKLFGWEIQGEIPNAKKFIVIGAPHTSNIDWFIVMGTAYSLGVRISWMGKHTLFSTPWGGILRWLGGIPIDRRQTNGTVGSAVEQFDEADELVLCITPEGTRAKVHGEWRKGFYYIAEGAEVPIVIAAFDFGRKVMQFGPTLKPSGDVEADMPRIISYYDGVQPCHPQKKDDT